MKVLVVGSGAREHALVWKIRRSERVEQVWCAPGNPGIAREAECVPVRSEDLDGLADFARRERPDLVVIGPEAPLVAGLADRLERLGLPVFGPSARAAEIEGSKAFCKDLLRRASVPAPGHQVFNRHGVASQYLARAAYPLVVKADGLAAGKGVFVCRTKGQALAAARRIMKDRVFGEAGARIVVEDCIGGPEISVLCLTDGETMAALLPAQDHKRLEDGDRGPNTGGMGAYAPTPFGAGKTAGQVEREILIPTLHALAREGRRFVGVLYAGIMVTDKGPQVLEFNARFGDPEAQAVLFLLKSDLASHLLACATGALASESIEWRPGAAITVVMAAKGYPSAPERGAPIAGIERAEEDPEVKVFHAGTAMDGDRLVAAGGRVLAVTAWGEDLRAARERAYRAVSKIRFPGAKVRTDIGEKALVPVRARPARPVSRRPQHDRPTAERAGR